MQTFRYEAADAQGRIETGTLEADSQRGALGQLRARGPVSYTHLRAHETS
ncbi:hypothetical protein, partial [Pseudomonas aeruginosa]